MPKSQVQTIEVRRMKVLRFISQQIDFSGKSPSAFWIADHIRTSLPTAYTDLEWLERQGYIRHTQHETPIVVTENGRAALTKTDGGEK